MKKIIIPILFIVIVILWYTIFLNGKKNWNDIVNKNIGNLTSEQVVKKYEKQKQVISASDTITNNTGSKNATNIVDNGNKNITNVIDNNSNSVSKSESIREILEKKWYDTQIDHYLKAICKDKSNIDDITCSSEYKLFAPMLYGFLIDMKKRENMKYSDVQNILISHILKNCSKLNNEWIELLERWIKENDMTCTKEIDNIYNNYVKKLSNKSIYSLDPKKFYKPISVYYSIPSDLTDNKQYKLQLLIFKNYNNLLKVKWISKKDFNKKLLDSVWAYSIENLKQMIIDNYIKLFNKYKLKDCWLSINGYSNYFEWVGIEKKAIKCINSKGIKDSFLKDYSKIDNLLSVYSYISKIFPTEKAQAKVLFWEKGIWLTNIVDIVSYLK